jgi:hypothetical protein
MLLLPCCMLMWLQPSKLGDCGQHTSAEACNAQCACFFTGAGQCLPKRLFTKSNKTANWRWDDGKAGSLLHSWGAAVESVMLNTANPWSTVDPWLPAWPSAAAFNASICCENRVRGGAPAHCRGPSILVSS